MKAPKKKQRLDLDEKKKRLADLRASRAKIQHEINDLKEKPEPAKNLRFDGTRWQTDIAFKGRRIRRFAGYTKGQALASLAKLRTASFEGQLEDLLDPKRADTRTIDGYIQALIDSPAWKQKRSHARDVCSFERLKEYFRAQQARLLSDIKPELLRAYITKRLEGDAVRPGTVNREMSFLRSILFIALEDGLIERNPLANQKGPRARKWKLEEHNSREQKVLEFLTPEKVRLLIEAAEPALQPVLTIAALTGMREGEILKMRPKDVDFVVGTIHIPAEHAKSKKARWIPIDAVIYNLLAGISKTGETLFVDPATGRPWSRIMKPFGAACKAVGIPTGRKDGIVFHDLRHFAAFQLVKHTDLVTASRILGHADVKMTMPYCHPSEADKRLAIERAGESLFSGRQKSANETEASQAGAKVN